MSLLHLRAAARALRAGGVAAYPTEGVWGLGCDPLNQGAVTRLLALKRRDWRKGLILIGASFDQLRPFVELPSKTAQKRAFATWPGPTTWVFPASEDAPMWLSGERDTLAIRVTAHPVARALCEAFGGALVSTSANREGRPPARSATEVRRLFGSGVDALVPGALGGLAGPTAIRDVISGLILRR
ncbi:MAG: Sua5/YciO/YrdC/YwlC family protein [Nevskia sp.]|nr:Sua5/YciO/YrdC/YwlC family protein [Nevskia sp.]